MALNITREHAALKKMTVTELRRKYAEVFGDAHNPPLAITRHARPLEECAECGLHLDDDGQPLPPHYKRYVLDRPEDV